MTQNNIEMNKMKLWMMLGILLTSMLTLSSCEEEEQELNLIRQFQPSTITTSNGETSSTISWTASIFTEPGQVTYEVQIARNNSFEELVLEATTPNNQFTVRDTQLPLRVDHFARVRALGQNNTGNSNWIVSNAFRILGEQLFLPVIDSEIRDKSVILRWRPTQIIDKLTVTSADGSSFFEFLISDEEVLGGEKFIDGLNPLTQYTAELFQGELSKGIISFTTKEPSVFTRVIGPEDDLFQVISEAESGESIGLEPGVYNLTDDGGLYVNMPIIQKTITLESVSGNPADTKINFREFTLRGSGAGLTLRGIEFDGAPATANGQQALYFINLAGLNSDGENANFTSVVVENCIVRNMGNCFMRGNRGSDNGHKIELIRIHDTQVFNSAQVNINWSFLTINRLEFRAIEITNSTFHKIGRAFVDWSNTITVSPQPTVLIDQCTINGFGMANGTKRIIFDANAANVDLNIQNSIFANSPYANDSAHPDAIRANGAGTLEFSNNNYFNLSTGGETPAVLNFPAALQMSNNTTVNLGWTFETSTFTLPANSPLRTSSTTGGAVGDPRWTF